MYGDRDIGCKLGHTIAQCNTPYHKLIGPVPCTHSILASVGHGLGYRDQNE